MSPNQISGLRLLPILFVSILVFQSCKDGVNSVNQNAPTTFTIIADSNRHSQYDRAVFSLAANENIATPLLCVWNFGDGSPLQYSQDFLPVIHYFDLPGQHSITAVILNTANSDTLGTTKLEVVIDSALTDSVIGFANAMRRISIYFSADNQYEIINDTISDTHNLFFGSGVTRVGHTYVNNYSNRTDNIITYDYTTNSGSCRARVSASGRFLDSIYISKGSYEYYTDVNKVRLSSSSTINLVNIPLVSAGKDSLVFEASADTLQSHILFLQNYRTSNKGIYNPDLPPEKLIKLKSVNWNSTSVVPSVRIVFRK